MTASPDLLSLLGEDKVVHGDGSNSPNNGSKQIHPELVSFDSGYHIPDSSSDWVDSTVGVRNLGERDMNRRRVNCKV